MNKIVLKPKKQNLFILIVFIIGFLLVGAFTLYFLSDTYKLKKIGYSNDEIKQIEKVVTNSTNKNIIISEKYNKYIVDILNDESFEDKNLNYYLNFFADYKGKYDSNLLKIINDQYFRIENKERYFLYYKSNPNLASRNIVEEVNCGLDEPYYTVDNKADVSKEHLILVNKYSQLEEEYVPKGLVKIDKAYGYQRMINKTTYEAFIKMYQDMSKENLFIFITSPYRSYNYQKSLYNNYVSKNGKENADRFSARAGYSEHQTGLAIDIAAKNSVYTKFANTEEYKWVKDNCYKYGFILRYPEDKEKQTGYMFEAWHYRYVGEEVAQYIYEHKITFDEYYEYFLK